MFNKKNKGFTLLEILLVVGIVAILASIVIIAINPGRQLATVRNTQRILALQRINSAIQLYYFDNLSYPASLPATSTEICSTGNATSSVGIDCTDLVDLTFLLPTYLDFVPLDPNGYYLSATGTGYMIMNNNNRIVLSAPKAELDKTIGIGL